MKSGFLSYLKILEVLATLDIHSHMAVTGGHWKAAASWSRTCVLQFMTVPTVPFLIILTQFTYLHTYLAPAGLWGLKPCSTLYLAGTECHVWLVTSEHKRRNHIFLLSLCFKSFLSDSLHSYSPLIPFLHPPRSPGGESLFRECKTTKMNVHYQAPQAWVSALWRGHSEVLC